MCLAGVDGVEVGRTRVSGVRESTGGAGAGAVVILASRHALRGRVRMRSAALPPAVFGDGRSA